MELFSSRSIQTLVDFKWKLVQRYTTIRLFIPFILYQATFFYYSNVIAAYKDDSENGEMSQNLKIQNYVASGILAIASVYFLVNEFRQLAGAGLNYFTSFWNYLDWLPALMIPLLIV
jgi:hypothetical protein